MVELVPKTKCYTMRETPYNSISQVLYDQIRGNSRSALVTAQAKSKMAYNLYG
jgi:hypothetical protein